MQQKNMCQQIFIGKPPRNKLKWHLVTLQKVVFFALVSYKRTGFYFDANSGFFLFANNTGTLYLQSVLQDYLKDKNKINVNHF